MDKKLRETNPIPWGQLFQEGLKFFKKPGVPFIGFSFLFLLLAIPGQADLPDLKTLNALQLWLWMSGVLFFLAISYFVFVVFILWIEGQLNNREPQDLKKLLVAATELMVPLTVLSVRGAFLFTFGLFLLIIPGFYYSFKYELASFCLILEGWKDDAPPIVRTEQIISNYGLTLLFLPVLMILEWASPWIFEGFLRLQGIPITFAIKVGISLAETVVAVFSNIYMTLIVLFLLKSVKVLPKG